MGTLVRMRQTLDEWLDNLPEDFGGVAIRAGLARGDRSPEYVAFYALEAFEWTKKKEHRPEIVGRDEVMDRIRHTITDNGGDEPGTMIRLIPFAQDGRKLRSWTHTAPALTNSWAKMPRGDRADQLAARGLAEAVSGVCRSQVAFVDKLTDVVAVLGATIADSQAAQNDIAAKLLDHQQAWIDSMAEDVEAVAKDLAETEEVAGVDPLRETVADIVRQMVGLGPMEESEPEPDDTPAE